MGADWSEVAGDIEILNNQGHGLVNLSMMIHTSASVVADGSTQSIDFETQGGLVYVASVMGYASPSQCIFIKVQDNNIDGLYDRVFFYWGNNGGSWPNTTGYFFDLATPTASGTMVTTIQGDNAILDIHNNTSGSIETFTVDGVSSLAVGLEHGVGTYGSAYFDNYDLNGGTAGPSMSVSAGAPGGSMTFDFANFSPAGLIAIVYGPAGSLTLTGGACAGMTIDVLPLNYPPISGLITLVADGSGAAQLTQTVPAGGAGLSVQAVDVATCTTAPAIVL